MIFHIDLKHNVLHAALTHCCGRKRDHIVDSEIRNHVELTIVENTRYRKIIWEDLLQLKKS